MMVKFIISLDWGNVDIPKNKKTTRFTLRLM